jgi:metal-responsive CopG/Arc/MetJ family transcriptional regulator
MGFDSKMGFPKKNRMTLISIHIEKENLEKIDALEKKMEGANRSRIIRRAVKEYLERMENVTLEEKK